MAAKPSLAQETGGQPEDAVIYLPSRLDKKLADTERSLRVVELEKVVRRSECFETLRLIRTACLQKSQMLLGKKKNARGEIINTRSQAMVDRLTTRISNATTDYNMSYDALKRLGVQPALLNPLKRLKQSDFSGLMKILSGDRELGQGHRTLPWFWAVRDDGEVTEPLIRSEEDMDAIRVEWFRGRERFRRWREEELWLRREIASTLYTYQDLAETWTTRSLNKDAQRDSAYKAYCIRQRDVFLGLLESGFRRTESVLKERPELTLCMRASVEFSRMFQPESLSR